MKNFTIILLVLLYTSSIPAAAFLANEIEWAPAVEGTLYRGNTFTNGPYMVKALEFSSPVQGYKNGKGDIVPETPVDPMVYLEVYKDGNFQREVLLTIQSGPDIDPDYEVMISGTGFLPGTSKEWVQEYYNPWSKVGISLRGKPELDVTVSTDKSTFTSSRDQTITGKVEVKNNGDAVARNVDVTLNIDDLKLRGGSTNQLHQTYMELKKGESKSFEVVLIVPDLLDQKSYNLTANTKSFDVKNLEYKSEGKSSIIVAIKQDYFTVSKAIKTRMYLKDTIMVRLTIANSGTYDMNDIVLMDEINPNFELTSDTPLFWNIPVLHPGEWKDIGYSLKPLETSLTGFAIPASTAGFTVNGRQYNISSEEPNVIVNGPKIIINKTTDKKIANISEDVTVNVSIKNIGNIATKAEVMDFLPESVSLVSGSTSLESTFLELNTPVGFSYIIRLNTWDDIELPAAVVKYTGVEYRGMTRSSLESERPYITLIDPTKNSSTPTLTPNVPEVQSEEAPLPPSNTSSIPTSESTPVTPGFDIMFGIIVLISTAFFLRRTR
ncbi:MAG: hypothetical protein OIN83_08220 [Candidatus Methanoperedens sp.]|nr:hypothetical protein [Candidatus Methanoperedens sp.]